MVIPGIASPPFVGTVCAWAAATIITAALAANIVACFIRLYHLASCSGAPCAERRAGRGAETRRSLS